MYFGKFNNGKQLIPLFFSRYTHRVVKELRLLGPNDPNR